LTISLTVSSQGPLTRENRELVTDDPVEFEK
jgi:hypothetical protein